MISKLLSSAIILTSFAAGHCASADEYSLLLEEARNNFQVIGDQHIQSALAEVQSAQQAIADKFLALSPELSSGWKAYLLWDQQQSHLIEPQKQDLQLWKKVYLRELRSAPGLEYPVFRQHRAATRKLIHALQANQNPSLQEQHNAALEQLSPLLLAGSATLDAAQAVKLASLVEHFDQSQQATQLTHAIRNEFTHHNVLAYVPQEYFASRLNKGISQPFPINDTIAGARVRGQGVLTANTEWSPAWNTNGSNWSIHIRGSSFSQTTAYKSRVSVNNQATLPFLSQGNVFFDLSGFRATNFKTSGKLRTRVLSISTPYRGLRHRIARRRAMKQQASSSYLTLHKSLLSLSKTFQKEINKALQHFNHRYHEKIVQPLLCLDQLPSSSTFSTTNHAVHVGLCFANSHQLAANHTLESFYQGPNLRLAIHQSAMNNLGSPLGGRKFYLAKTLRRLLANKPQKDATETPDIQITLADSSPIRVTLDDNQVTLSLLGDSFLHAGQKYNALEIELTFSIHNENGKVYLVREGNPTMAYPRPLDGSKPKRGIRDLSLRRILSGIIKRDLPEKITINQLSLPFLTELLDTSSISNLHSENGWIVLEAAPVAIWKL